MGTLRSLLEQATKLQTIIQTKHPFDENALIQLQKAYKNEITMVIQCPGRKHDKFI